MGSKLDEFARFVDVHKALEYVEKRRHEDGGFCFFRVLGDTNVNDTYYAVKIYELLGLEVPEKERTIEFLEKAIQPQTAVVAIAMALEGLAILGAKDIAKEQVDIVYTKYNPLEDKFAVGLGGSEEFGTATPLEATYWVVKAFRAIGQPIGEEEKEKIREFIMKFRMGNGFGVKQPTSTMTYQALYTLYYLGYRPPKSLHFRNCELCGDWGGFTEVPYSLPPTSSRLSMQREGLSSREILQPARGGTSGSSASSRTPTAASDDLWSLEFQTSRTHTGRLWWLMP
ncbi:MAG: hypothetical protein PWQ79_425 [Thermococcaceae archaeon]|nr:hypothetical protein [Thermococcaceae archaeon]MDK2913510.1 hypothetical protein [Thermococcaceae archaeon]